MYLNKKNFIALELKKFISGAEPYSDNYRGHFPKLSMTVAEIQHKGTSELYAAFKSRSQDKTSEMQIDVSKLGPIAEARKALEGAIDSVADDALEMVDDAKGAAKGAIGGASGAASRA